MKKIYSFILMTVIALTVNAQLVIRENFTDYTNGNLDIQGGWVPGTGTPDVQVNNANQLYYPSYVSGTRYISVTNQDGKDPYKPFSTPITLPNNTNRFIYMSFVVRVSSTTPTGSAQSISLQNTANAFNIARFYIEKNAANAVQFGISVGSELPAVTGFNYALNTTYLIVIRYDVVSGNNNDNAYLWVNPNTASEPTPGSANASHLVSNGEVNYGSPLNALRITQSGATSPIADYDGFLVAHGASSAEAWTALSPVGASLPIVLSSFNAANEGLSTKLIWNAAEESDLANFVIEKSTDGRTFTAIGTVKATNQKAYSFIDGSAGDNSYYRLKMVDIDGTFKYSYVVSIKSKQIANISLSPNPVKNNLIIQHPKVITESNIQIISANGQLVRNIRLASNAVLSYVDMSGFTSGLYHIVYKSGSDMFTKTVIKQ